MPLFVPHYSPAMRRAVGSIAPDTTMRPTLLTGLSGSSATLEAMGLISLTSIPAPTIGTAEIVKLVEAARYIVVQEAVTPEGVILQEAPAIVIQGALIPVQEALEEYVPQAPPIVAQDIVDATPPPLQEYNPPVVDVPPPITDPTPADPTPPPYEPPVGSDTFQDVFWDEGLQEFVIALWHTDGMGGLERLG